MSQPFPGLTWSRALDRPDLLAEPTAAALHAWSSADPAVADGALVAEIDPDLADTAALTEAYDLPLEVSANCVVVLGRRAGEERPGAAVVPATTRADVNNVVRRRLDVRKASFMPMDAAVASTAMEYGGITPVGLPAGWPVLVDARVVATPWIVLGSGVRRSKLAMPGALLGSMPGVEVVEGLGLA